MAQNFEEIPKLEQYQSSLKSAEFPRCDKMQVKPLSVSGRPSRSDGSAAATDATAVIKKYTDIYMFHFEVGGNWDDKNTYIFLLCYRETIKKFEDYCTLSTPFWAKIVKRAIASGGDPECFTVNYCIELAQRLKVFIREYEVKLQGVDLFEELKHDVSDLIPYFPPPEYSLIKQMKRESAKKVNNLNAASEAQLEQLILKVCHKNLHLFGRFRQKCKSIFKSVSEEVSALSGVKTDVQPILKKMKLEIIKTLNSEQNPDRRARMFKEITRDFTVFDFVEPRKVKKKDYVPTVERSREPSKSKIRTSFNTGKK